MGEPQSQDQVRQRIGELALKFMDDLTETFSDEVQVDVFAITAMVTFPANGQIYNGAFFRCEDERVWIQEAIFNQAAQHAAGAFVGGVAPEDDDDD